MEITAADALALRMTSLLLRGGVDRSSRTDVGGDHGGPTADVAGVVTWFGAMQAQDLNSGLWSFGARLPAWTCADVNGALERREALRTWPMRGTVHFVPSRDAHWMLDLMGVRALAGAAARRAFLGLTEQVVDRAVEVLGEALVGGKRLTRAQCVLALADAGLEGGSQFGYHLLWYASQRGVTCIAPNVGKEQTFVLLDEWVPDPVRLERDEALKTIAVRYFRSHGPTTRQDFAGWTGLTALDAKRGIAAAGDQLVSVRVEGQEMFVDPALLDTVATGADLGGVGSGGVGSGGAGLGGAGDLLVLPGFDEYLLGFKDRSLMLAAEHKDAIIPGGNGVFQSTIVRGGRVIGTWKRSVGRNRIDVSVQPLMKLGAKDRNRVEAAFQPYARFMALPVLVTVA